MPRDGSGVYTQPLPDVVPATTIASTVYNGFVNDVETDLNQPRPIIAGGTGATNATTALYNVSGEKAAQLVTNYDTQLWVPGSFYSASSATNPPVAAHAFAGTAYINEPLANPPTNQNVILEARDENDTVTPGRKYVREKKAGVWGSWAQEGIAGGIFVLKTGDTMTGNLTFNTPANIITFNSTGTSASNAIVGQRTAVNRWVLQLGSGDVESGGNSGSHCVLYGYDDGGTNWQALAVNRTTRRISLTQVTDHPAGMTVGSTTQPSAAGLAKFAYTGGVNFAVATRPTTDVGYTMAFYNAADTLVGGIQSGSTGVNFLTTSDARLKEDLKSFDAGNIVDDTRVYDFAWKTTGERSYGVIAQQAVDVYPAAVGHDEAHDAWGIDYSKYVPVILQELKALRARVAELEGTTAAKPGTFHGD